MTIKTWLDAAIHDADRRGLPELKPLLETLARAMSALRTAERNADAGGEFHPRHDVSGTMDPQLPVSGPGDGR